MGLMQRALETYESHAEFASQNREGAAMLAPVAHSVASANLEITLDGDGRFVHAAAVDKDEPKIVMPVTESSAGRTSGLCAHPLCEQLGYLMPENEKKYALYVQQLAAWAQSDFSHPKLHAVLRYVQGGTILADLRRCGLLKQSRGEEKIDDKLLVRWRILGEEPEACWLDRELFQAFTAYYCASRGGRSGLCMVSGEETGIAEQHPKGVIPINGNAKLISSNDAYGFTYRGRFSESWQAAEVGYAASQKAHNTLRWLEQEQGVRLGGRTFLFWNPQGRKIVKPTQPLLRAEKPIFRPSDYQKALQDALAGRKSELREMDGVVIAAFDAATSGRLALTYYNEFRGHDFLERLRDWDQICCWPHRYFGIESPSLRMITDCAFGIQRTEKGFTKLETDERILRQQMQRLIACRVERAGIGADIVKALAGRASRLENYRGTDGVSGQRDIREDVLFTACAVIRKYRYDRFKEEWNMALEPERWDRSYQFGRFLAVAEKVEQDAFASGEERVPNAMRMQSIFCQRPMYAASQLEKHLERAYFPRLSPGRRIYYKNLLGQILEVISTCPQEDRNKALEDSYLLGYYLQRNALYQRKVKEEVEENEA